MKKKLTALLLALALVYTFALPVAAAQKTVEWEGVTYTVDTEAQTIHDGESVYEYQVELYRDGYTLEITYPNGAFWSALVTESDGTYGWNEEYDMKAVSYTHLDVYKRQESAGPLFAYAVARRREADTVRVILSGKRNGLEDGRIRERLRETYV